MPDETQRRYLFVAIDRAARWVYIHIYKNQTETSSVDFLRRVKQAAPMPAPERLNQGGYVIFSGHALTPSATLSRENTIPLHFRFAKRFRKKCVGVMGRSPRHHKHLRKPEANGYALKNNVIASRWMTAC